MISWCLGVLVVKAFAGRDCCCDVHNPPYHVHAVLYCELYAGVSVRDRRVVERLERDFGSARRILVPNLNDWTQAGKVLARLAAAYGYERIGQARLSNDALIAMSAARQGITVITAHERDFARLAQFRPFLWEVRTARNT